MVGLVLVSHSRDLAEALIALVKQVSAQDIPIAAAAGVGPECREFGTDAVAISEAIQSVYSSAHGVLVLMDLGSALLSAEMALEFLPDDMQANIRFCAAPLVEGAIAAGVQIGLGSPLDTIVQEARQALYPKLEQLGEFFETPDNLSTSTDNPPDDSQEIIVEVVNPHGLHIRPAAHFVKTAAQFDADIRVYKLAGPDQPASPPVPATSLSSLMILGVACHDRIGILAAGCEAEQALDELRLLVADNFGEPLEMEETSISDTVMSPNDVLNERKIIPLSEGIAYGPATFYQEPRFRISREPVDRPEREWKRLQGSFQAVRREIEQRHQSAQATFGAENAEIFEAHRYILDDHVLVEQVRERIFNDHLSAAAAWNDSVRKMADSYRDLSDACLQDRVQDVLDIGNQVLSKLFEQEGEMAPPTLVTPGILIVQELSPTFVSQLNPQQVLGLIAQQGGPTDHSSILARSLGIPAIAVPSFSEMLHEHEPSIEGSTSPELVLALDAFHGELWFDPSADLLSQLQQQQSAWQTERRRHLQICHEPAETLEGNRIGIMANAGGSFDADIAERNGAEGIGVLRTEFLYLSRESAPTEDEQIEMLLTLGKSIKGKPIYARTLDIGGDKSVPYLRLPHEENPFLGVRSIRLSLRSIELFTTQLRAILRAAAETDVRIMFPMISQVEELLQTRQRLEEVHHTLDRECLPHRWPIEVAMMVETPSAALLTSSCARYVNYFSIGTNDLTQYTFAAERGNPELNDYTDSLHPAVLHLMHHVVEAAHQNGKHVGVCGELASDPAAIPVLIGLGVDELSLNPANIPAIKTAVRKVSQENASELTAAILQLDTATAVREMIASSSFL
ncbi:phosphoenolpyruvate--protein phosphotransferase [candidate division KSB3 bacterium]|uniref:Phosphoenolpyruvate--protein phosphotransferase n=1 Tax=candidate division KSB3 bacterium TaxID=2044937 RepID=A0A2G6KH23_9BACT|nr:MAG: phosphoenolpyruvate--protein phosphotransferase [candidate division KSB3 bacterium]